jgi:hypothetical protein
MTSSEVEHHLARIPLRVINALRCASGGALDFEPSEHGWIRLREPIENTALVASLRTDQALIRKPIASWRPNIR